MVTEKKELKKHNLNYNTKKFDFKTNENIIIYYL